MYWSAGRNTAVTLVKRPGFALLLRSPTRSCSTFSHSTSFPSPGFCFGGCIKQTPIFYLSKGYRCVRWTPAAVKQKKSAINALNDKDIAHVLWWKERLEKCKKPSTANLVKRLVYSNLLGVDVTLKNGSLKEGTLNWEILQFKSKFPREILLCRVGDFYEAIGIDACVLVEYAGLNPFGGLRSDSIPRAGCPVVNLRQTLDDLTCNGYSVCIVEEVQGPTQARSRKSRFISGHAHPGSPYVFGLVGDNHDLDFPEPMPVIGISRSAGGYCLTSVLETMKVYSAEDGLTEEALVTKIRTCRFHQLFLHTSLRNNSSGTCRWGEYGEGGLLWGECAGRSFEWFDGNPVPELIQMVKELHGFGEEVEFRNVTVSSENRPRPLHLGTATQIGAIPTEGIPCLLKVLLPSNCLGLPVLYMRDLLLNPPAYEVAFTIQAICRLISNVTCSIPDFTCVPTAKIVKLLEMREANHIEFCRIKDVLDEILHMYKNVELKEILRLLMDPTWVATGLKIDFETLVNECKFASKKICELISLDGESDQKVSLISEVPREFFEDLESSWKGRVKRIHIDEEFSEVERAAHGLSVAILEDFLPIIRRIKATTAPLGGPKGEILYAREHEAVWFKGKRFTPAVWGDTPGEEQIKQLRPAIDSKGRKVGEEWFTTVKVEEALGRYHNANERARARVLELLRDLSAELLPKVNVLVFSSMVLVVAKALFAHVSEARRRKWVFPTLVGLNQSKDMQSLEVVNEMKLVNLFPYWLDSAEGNAVRNTVDMQSLFLLTGPNGGGKSSLLRSVCASALLGICGFMVPAESAVIPHFDSIMLHMKSYDSPVDGKSSFQVEMSELRSVIAGATSCSLVLIDEICRGTETAKGTCIAGSIIETLDNVGCLGIVSTHLHGIFSLPLATKKMIYKAMGSELVNGHTRPTWTLIDGICRESLAFETAKREGMPDALIRRAEDLYRIVNTTSGLTSKSLELDLHKSDSLLVLENGKLAASHQDSDILVSVEKTLKEAEDAITIMCQRKLIELYKQESISELVEVNCVAVGAREQPPPSTVGTSCVYVAMRSDKKLYVGVTDDLDGRIRAHRSKEEMKNARFLFFKVPGKSVACQIETYLINQLPRQGFRLSNITDGKHRNFGSSKVLHQSVAVH